MTRKVQKRFQFHRHRTEFVEILRLHKFGTGPTLHCFHTFATFSISLSCNILSLSAVLARNFSSSASSHSLRNVFLSLRIVSRALGFWFQHSRITRETCANVWEIEHS